MQKTLFVVDDHTLAASPSGAISFTDYLKDYPKLGEPKTRIINLCNTERYLSQGYYCSLLAEARNHSVLPSVKTINALRGDGASLWFDENHFPAGKKAMADLSLVVCMGESLDPLYQPLATKIFRELPAPLLQLNLQVVGKGVRVQVSRLSLGDLDAEQTDRKSVV